LPTWSKLLKCMVRRLTAREKLVDEEKSASMYPACCVERCLLAMMRYAAYLSFEIPRLYKGPFGKQVSGTPFDCSFILTYPVQTSVGKLNLDS